MRWERLFDDIEAQFVEHQRRERDAEVSDRIRAERAAIGLSARLSASRGSSVSLRLRGGWSAQGQVADHGEGWLALSQPTRMVLISTHSVISGTGFAHGAAADSRARLFGLGHALRGISRDRAPVSVWDIDSGSVEGTIDAVGSDALDLAEHPVDSPRRKDSVRAMRLIPFAAIAAVVGR